MWGLELPYRRYSVPETIMRKVKLRQSSSSSSDSSSRRVTRRPMARTRHVGRNRYCMNTSTKGVQTSPYSNHCTEGHAENQCLLHSRHHGQPRRATSVPDLSSDAEGRDNRRPSSARDKLLERYTQPTCNGPPIVISPGGTPSPSQASNYSSTLHRCDVYSNTWSCTTSSEYTLGQTVSDRTISTQDSTLSLQSSTPESSTSNSFSSAERAAQKIFLENSIFSPAGNFIAVHTESLLIQPIEIIERRENWNFGFSDSPESDPLAALSGCHRSIAINTEPPEMIGAPMVDKSTCAYGVFNDKSAQVRDSDIENELMIDKSTYIEMLNGLLRNGNGEEDRKEVPDIQAIEEPFSVDIGINTDQCMHSSTALLDDEKDNENQFSGYPQTTPLSKRAVFKIPNIKIFKESTTESQQTDDRSNAIEEAKIYVTKSTTVEENLFRNIEGDQAKQICKYCSKEELTEKDNTFNKEIKHLWKPKPERSDVGGPFERKLCADVACTGCNYKDYPEVDGVIARYSAIPRSNSMLVNTSSIDYSSDSDLSLTDSLEDCNEHRAEHYDRPNTRHDNRLVRGEVSLEQEQTNKRYPKSNKTYAYFLSITGEQDMVRQYPLPDWLKVRLQRREEEIKKLFQIRLNKHQTIVYRRRKKTMKRITENEDSNSTVTKEHTLQKVQKRCAEDAEDAGKSIKNVETAGAEDMPSTSTANNIDGQVRKEELQVNSNSNPIETKTTIEKTKNGALDLQQNTNKDNNYLHISEVIKIEMLNSLNTVITKEKQINLNKNLFTRDQNNFQTSKCIKNESSPNAQKIIMRTNIGNFQMDNNSLPELENECQISSKERDKDIVKIYDTKEPESKTKEKAIIKKKQDESYSFKQFKPLFQSKADDQTVAEILLSAMKNNSLKNDDKEFKIKEREEASRDEQLSLSGQSKTVDEHKVASTKDTPKLKYNSVAFSEHNVKVERSCNTITPYLSAMVQTKESFLKEKCFSFAEGEEGETEELKDAQSTSLITAESTHSSPMTSSLVQTNETFLKNDKSFIESESLVLIRDQGTDVFQESSNGKNEDENVDNCNLENEQVSVFVQTEQNIATINEVKPLIIHSKIEEFKGNIKNDEHEGKTYTSNKKLSTNSNRSRRHGMDLHKQNCKYYCGGSHEHKASQVLELNVQPCTCHMCTLNKKVGSRNDKLCEEYHSALQSSSGIRRKLQCRSSPSEHKEEKKPFQRYSNNKRSNISNKFQRRFEDIPEEKNSSAESVGEVQITPLKFTPDKKKLNTCGNDNFEKTRLDQDEHEEDHTSEVRDNKGKVTKESRSNLSVLKERENVMCSSEVKSTQTNGSKKSNVVFGRFKAIKNDASTISDGKLLGEGVEVMQQYKGRAALAAAPVDGQEQLLTLSKGWINFYLLKDNQEFSDSNNDEVQQFHSESLVQRAVSPIRILKGSEFKEEQVEEFTVEIRATPEPIQTSDKSLLLPNLHQDILRKRKSVKPQPQSNKVCLPEIQTSSSSSTPENLGEKIVPIEEKSKKCHPLPVVNGRRSSRHEIRMKRKSVTAFEQIPKPEPLFRLAEEFASGFERGHSAKAVEVALSEHSVSSISSTLILSEESPSPKHERKSRHRQRGGQIIQQQSDRNGSSWTVTVAGTSGNNSNIHPDVEMKLTFGNKQTGNNNKELCDENEKRLVKFNAKKSSLTSSSKRKGRMMEEFAHTSRDEKQRSIQYMPGVMLQNSQDSKFEGTVSQKDLGGYLDHENTSQLSRRSKGSFEGSSDATSLCSDLQVTGLAITPESKPYVPTQSERDLVRRQRYKFTR